MMYKICSVFFAALVVASATGAPSTGEPGNLRRALDDDCYKCSDNDPCGNGKEFYKHCSKHKYIQCAQGGHCYDMHCPEGTVWDHDEKACDYGKQGGGGGGGDLAPCGDDECENPCTKENIKDKKFYHPHCEAKRKYLQCGAVVGMCYEMKCAEGTKFDEDEEMCVPKGGKADMGPCGECDDNPCTKENIKDDKYYHPHCAKSKKYLQCGAEVGMCFERSCSGGTKWDQDEETCVMKN